MEKFLIIANHANFVMHLALTRGMLGFIAGTRTKIEGCTFESKDGKGIDY